MAEKNTKIEHESTAATDLQKLEALRLENAAAEAKILEELKAETLRAEELKAEAKKVEKKRADAAHQEAVAESRKEEAKRKSAAYQRERALEIVRGTFTFLEVPGGVLEFNLKLHKDDAVGKVWTFRDGEKREVPRYIADHLHTSGRYPEHQYAQSPDGKNVQRVNRLVARYDFVPDGFTPVAESSLYTVENVLL